VHRLEVKIPTATMLKVLWAANLSKGGWMVETERPIPAESRVKVALTLPGTQLLIDATVLECASKKKGKGFFVKVELAQLREDQRAAIERIIGDVKDPKGDRRDRVTLLDDPDIDLDPE